MAQGGGTEEVYWLTKLECKDSKGLTDDARIFRTFRENHHFIAISCIPMPCHCGLTVQSSQSIL